MHPLAIKEELKRIKDLGLKILSLASSYEGKYLDDPLFDEVFEFAARSSYAGACASSNHEPYRTLSGCTILC